MWGNTPMSPGSPCRMGSLVEPWELILQRCQEEAKTSPTEHAGVLPKV